MDDGQWLLHLTVTQLTHSSYSTCSPYLLLLLYNPYFRCAAKECVRKLRVYENYMEHIQPRQIVELNESHVVEFGDRKQQQVLIGVGGVRDPFGFIDSALAFLLHCTPDI
jgi:hypothetical protein